MESITVEVIEEKLSLITDIWNHFVLEEKFFQDKIRYCEEVRQNYYGDIMHYLSDTFEVIRNHGKKKILKGDFNDHIFYITGMLQTLYVHQDLIDEILHIFKKNKSSSDIKLKIRNLRNELVGHPISRDKNGKLVSSVFFGDSLSYNTINYLKYNYISGKRFENIELSLDDLLEEHKQYLFENLEIVLQKLNTIIKSYKKDIQNVYNTLNNDKRNYINLVKISKIYLERVYQTSPYLTENILKELLERNSDHSRYQNLKDIFFDSVKEAVAETLESLKLYQEKISGSHKKKVDCIMSNIVFDLEVVASSSNINTPIKDDMNRYYLKKLYEKKYLDGINILLEKYCDNGEIVTELENMQNNFNDSDLEYYSSLLFVEKLIKGSVN